jgi:FtsZ-interacting cell division protein ZipA
MPAWVWVLIVVAVVVVVAAVVWQWTVRTRTKHLRGQFGSEYDRVVEGADSRREAETELAAREKRHEQFELRPLSTAAHDRYVESWRVVQAQFVDDPRGAVASADHMIQSVMRDCGYPVEDFDQRASDLSVDHSDVVEHYREGHRLASQSARVDDSTEDLRHATQHYRALFEELVDSSGNGRASTDDSRRISAGKEM